mmetsp:Transcript_23543/g.93324  ORF Transcript_23543/g.93324 Transcript_23543/m.93324 type:complete len:229 (-) Transcript_23543:458-1144(-)
MRRLGNDREALVETPAQQQLRGRHARQLSKFTNSRVLLGPGAAQERFVRDERDAAVAEELDRVLAVHPRVDFNLVRDRRHARLAESFHIFDAVVAQADAADDAVVDEPLECSIRFHVARARPMDIAAIQIPDAEQLHGRPHRPLNCGTAEADDVRPHLGRDGELAAGYVGIADAVAHFGFIRVERRAVEVPVADFDRGPRRGGRLGGRNLGEAITDGRHGPPVAQRDR